jgi:hypothetical protein
MPIRKPPAKGSKGGKPRLEPTATDIKRIEEWAGKGHVLIQIARGLNVSPDTLARWRADHEAVAQALEAGRAAEHELLLTRLMKKAMDGDTVALLFLLKTRHGYREGEQLASGNRVSIIFSLPGAMKPEQFTVEQ